MQLYSESSFYKDAVIQMYKRRNDGGLCMKFLYEQCWEYIQYV